MTTSELKKALKKIGLRLFTVNGGKGYIVTYYCYIYKDQVFYNSLAEISATKVNKYNFLDKRVCDILTICERDNFYKELDEIIPKYAETPISDRKG